MKDDEYFNAHIPHRVNLLITFRERYAPNPRRPGYRSGEPRDLFRCSKDISMMMVRFFCGEMGLRLPRKGDPQSIYKGLELEPVRNWKIRFNIRQFTENEAKGDTRYQSLLTVMKTANRAVAHVEDVDVDHPIKTEKDHPILFDSITWIEELVESHMYRPNNRRLADAMLLSDNVM